MHIYIITYLNFNFYSVKNSKGLEMLHSLFLCASGELHSVLKTAATCLGSVIIRRPETWLSFALLFTVPLLKTKNTWSLGALALSRHFDSARIFYEVDTDIMQI